MILTLDIDASYESIKLDILCRKVVENNAPLFNVFLEETLAEGYVKSGSGILGIHHIANHRFRIILDRIIPLKNQLLSANNQGYDQHLRLPKKEAG